MLLMSCCIDLGLVKSHVEAVAAGITARIEGWCYLDFVSQFAHFLTGLVQNYDFCSASN
jgi:hypothetical protein